MSIQQDILLVNLHLEYNNTSDTATKSRLRQFFQNINSIMKIAVILRGQSRNSHQSRLINSHFLEAAHPYAEFSYHIYNWTSVQTSMGGTLGSRNQYYHHPADLYKELKSIYNPATLDVVPDHKHYRQLIIPAVARYRELRIHNPEIDSVNLYWKYSQIIAQMRAQDQLVAHCLSSGYRPDLILDTRNDAIFRIEPDDLQDITTTVNSVKRGVIVANKYTWMDYTAVDDEQFFYSFNTLLEQTQSTPDERYWNSFSKIKLHEEWIESGIYNSHILFPHTSFHRDTEWLPQVNYAIGDSLANICYARLLHTIKDPFRNIDLNKPLDSMDWYSIADRIDQSSLHKSGVETPWDELKSVYINLHNKLKRDRNPDNS